VAHPKAKGQRLRCGENAALVAQVDDQFVISGGRKGADLLHQAQLVEDFVLSGVHDRDLRLGQGMVPA
jgi:hypothetical protein